VTTAHLAAPHSYPPPVLAGPLTTRNPM
jgi:hypothetical protein